MERVGIPNTLIRCIRFLYQDATTKVIINGWITEGFSPSRGVRQGDPLSCPLFILAIEALAQTTMNDPHISSLRSEDHNVRCSMYADDTVIMLKDYQELPRMRAVIAKYEKGSVTKLNPRRCELLPIGSLAKLDPSHLACKTMTCR